MQSASERLTFYRRRGGVYLNRARRSLWIHGRDPEDFEAISPVLRWLRTAVLTDRLLLSSNRPTTCQWLRIRYPNDNVLPPPWAVGPLVARFFQQLRPAMMVCIGADNGLSPRVLAHAHERHIPVVLIDAAEAPPASVLPYVHHYEW
jgi:3-deoxy-D-manno-octulosonic-acid transferase